ncbi:hypothetical protein AAL_00037 [Moelleriella libera RCEF 2490]|uniref:Heat-labile enterotoxin, A chain n=1 Tax=Moelleriella libera RCEF 2490 TaxID=1081109 RepID=A0A166UID1_9HYPO|nr:hypothetical protein AAL_00037 [Moelleriella libera RCEF 2490]
MYVSSYLVFLGLVGSLVSNVAANTLYRGDARGPKIIKEAGGFKAKGFTNPEGTLFEHVSGLLKHPSRDPFISTTPDIEVAKGHAGKGYLYTLDETRITEPKHDVAAEYEKAKKKYPYPKEKEVAVEHLIPWDAVTKVERKIKGVWKSIPLPKKRAIGFTNDEFFVN